MQLVDVYKAMADENRLRLLSILSEGAFNVRELTAIIEATQSNVSHHLKTLQSAGLVGCRREGTWGYYYIEPHELDSPVSSVIRSFLEAAPQASISEFLLDDKAKAKEILEKRRDEAKEFFDSVAPRWSELSKETINSEEYLNQLRDFIPDTGTLLELGIGSGALLSKILPRSGSTIGVDYSPAMLEEAKKTLAPFDVDLRLGYLERLPLTDNSVDCALSHMVLHHIAKPVDAIKDAARVIRPGGKLLVVDLSAHNREYMRERYADLWLGFEQKEFQSWIKAAGLKTESVKTLGTGGEVFILVAVKR